MFTLNAGHCSSASGYEPVNIIDHTEVRVGFINAMREDHYTSLKKRPPEREFVVIARTELDLMPDSKPILHALQIKWNDGIAYRENIAKIEEEACIRQGSSWKLIALM